MVGWCLPVLVVGKREGDQRAMEGNGTGCSKEGLDIKGMERDKVHNITFFLTHGDEQAPAAAAPGDPEGRPLPHQEVAENSVISALDWIMDRAWLSNTS